MLNSTALISLINNQIKQNGVNAVTGEILNSVLIEMVNSSFNLITNNNLAGLSDWQADKIYKAGVAVIRNSNIYKALGNTTLGTFIEGEYELISSSTSDLTDYVKKTNSILLDNNNLIKSWNVDESFDEMISGIYLVNANTVETNINSEYPILGKGIMFNLLSNVQAESLRLYYSLTYPSKFFTKKVSENWIEFSAYPNYAYRNGLVKTGNTIEVGGDFDNIILSGTDNEYTNFEVRNVNTINFETHSTQISGTSFNVSIPSKSLTESDFLIGIDSNNFLFNYPKSDLNLSGTDGSFDNSYIRTNATTATIGGLPSGTIPNYASVQSVLDAILYPFVNPSLTFTSNSTHEKGLTINKTVNYSITLNSALITSKFINLNGTLQTTLATNSGSYNSVTNLTHSNSPNPSAFYPTHTFQLFTTYSNFANTSAFVTVDFVAPTYYGSLNFSNIDETNIKTLTKRIRKLGNDTNLSFTCTLKRFVYAYPKNFGVLTSIKDSNNFETKDAYTRTEITFTLADTTTEIYYVYYLSADTTQTAFLNSFYF